LASCREHLDHIQKLISDIDTLLALAPEELAPTLLVLASRNMQNGMFKLANMTTTFAGSGFAATRVRPYPQNKEGEISIAIREAWQWLIFNFLIMPADGTTDGWLFARKVFPKTTPVPTFGHGHALEH
jgi:hypothetical protein